MNHFLITPGIHPVGSVWATMGDLTNDRFTDVVCAEAFVLGEKLVRYWEQKKRSKQVDKKLTEFKERMRWLITNQKDGWPYELIFGRKIGVWKKNRIIMNNKISKTASFIGL